MAPRKSKATAAAEEQVSSSDNGAKRAVLDKAVGDILKRYGDGSIVRLGEAKHMETEAYPTGSLSPSACPAAAPAPVPATCT